MRARARRRRVLLALAAPLLLALQLGVGSSAPVARADGDPASDVLLTSSLRLPYDQRVSPPVLAELRRTIARADAAGFPVKVALLLADDDLGAYGGTSAGAHLLAVPDAYVQLLSFELAYAYGGAIVIVEPSGVGVRGFTPHETAERLVSTITLRSPVSADGLAQAASLAIRTLAQADGHPIGGPVASTASSSSSSGVDRRRRGPGRVVRRAHRGVALAAATTATTATARTLTRAHCDMRRRCQCHIRHQHVPAWLSPEMTVSAIVVVLSGS